MRRKAKDTKRKSKRSSRFPIQEYIPFPIVTVSKGQLLVINKQKHKLKRKQIKRERELNKQSYINTNAMHHFTAPTQQVTPPSPKRLVDERRPPNQPSADRATTARRVLFHQNLVQ